MKIDAGEENYRNLVAGLRKYYSADELKGKKIIVIANLKPAKLRGVLSEGMLLAADDGENLRALEVKDAKPGTSVKIEGYENKKEQISYDDFEKIKMTVKDEKAVYNGIVLKAGNEEVSAEGIKDDAKIS